MEGKKSIDDLAYLTTSNLQLKITSANWWVITHRIEIPFKSSYCK